MTRSRLAEAEARHPEPRPFASASRGAGRGTEHTGPDCWVCAEARRMDAAHASGDAEAPACSGCGYVYCQCGVAGARVPPRAGQPAEVYR